MSKNRVIVLGAGFSVPAGIPTQQKLLKEIVMGVGSGDFLEEDPVFSKKYLHSFIRIGIFLLENYSVIDVKKIKTQYQEILDFEKNAKAKIEYIQDTIQFLQKAWQLQIRGRTTQNYVSCCRKKFIFFTVIKKKFKKLTKNKLQVRPHNLNNKI